MGGRALGVTKVKRELTKATGIPTTKAGVERKIGGAIIKAYSAKSKLVSSQETLFFLIFKYSK